MSVLSAPRWHISPAWKDCGQTKQEAQIKHKVQTHAKHLPPRLLCCASQKRLPCAPSLPTRVC